MRVKNREIRRRRHRKEQKIKDAQRELRVQFGDKKTATAVAPAEKAAAPKKAAPKKTAETGEKKPAAKKPAAKKKEAAEPAAE